MGVDAVIFDWGGTLTPWRTADGQGWWRITDRLVDAGVVNAAQAAQIAATLHAAEEEVWRRCRDEQLSGSLIEVFAAAQIEITEIVLAAHDAEWDHATYIDPQAPAMFEALRERGIRIGVLSNTSWSRRRHESIFERDGVGHYIDGAIYTSEIAVTKPHPDAFRAAMTAVGVADPQRCVFVGDRLFDDIYGARQLGMRTVYVPHSDIPQAQRGHSEGEPHAVISSLSELIALVDAWSQPRQSVAGG